MLLRTGGRADLLDDPPRAAVDAALARRNAEIARLRELIRAGAGGNAPPPRDVRLVPTRVRGAPSATSSVRPRSARSRSSSARRKLTVALASWRSSATSPHTPPPSSHPTSPMS